MSELEDVYALASQEDPGRSASEDRYARIRALWLKVIIRAVFDWVSYRDSDKMRLKKEAEKAHHWLFGKSDVWNGFESICDEIDINPEKLRTWAKSISRANISKIEHLEREVDRIPNSEFARLGWFSNGEE